MIKVVAKFKEKFWDKEANAEIPMDTIYMGEALSVESQEDGVNVQQKFNGHNNGIFLKYKDLSALQLDDYLLEDFKDPDLVEAKCALVNATKKITFVGVNFTVGEDVEKMSDPTDIDITANFKKDGKVEDKVLYLQANERFEIREVSVENAEVTVKRVEVITPAHDGLPATSEDMIQATVHGMQGNVVMSVLVHEVKKEGEDTSSDSSSSSGSSGSSSTKDKVTVSISIAAGSEEFVEVSPESAEVVVGEDAEFTVTKKAEGTVTVSTGTLDGTKLTVANVESATTVTVTFTPSNNSDPGTDPNT